MYVILLTGTQIEKYLSERSGAHFSHGICPDCFVEHLQT
jgi:hypothetical protein